MVSWVQVARVVYTQTTALVEKEYIEACRPFHPRCPKAVDRCRTEAPGEKNIGAEDHAHLVRCHLY